MPSYLDAIVLRKKKEVELLKKHKKFSLEKISQKKVDFKKALLGKKFSLISEIKRRSPSKGELANILDPVNLAREYLSFGASALSVLTDEDFGGSLKDLSEVSAKTTCPILRKDFIIDPIQLQESAACGADAVLLIVATLGDRTAHFLQEAKKLQLAAIVEVHDEAELNIALDAGADVIGVNSRNLSTFHVDLSIAERLCSLIPDHIVKIAESGIFSKVEASRMREAGFNAILVGEALVKSNDRKALIKELLR